MKYLRVYLGLVLLFLLAVSLVGADEAADNKLVTQALAAVDQQCNTIQRNQVCYGHALLNAEPQLGVDALGLDAEGDIEDLAKIQSLRLSGMDTDAGIWGVALMLLRANIPEEDPSNVTLLAFGDVALDNAVKEQTHIEAQVAVNSYVNVRLSPSAQAGVLGTLAPNQTFTAVERSADGEWLHVILPDSEEMGWLSASLATSEADLSTLNVASPAGSFFEPMQAFYFENGGSSSVSAIPRDGLLIQTPEGVGEVQLLINEVNIQIGSTVFFQAQAGGQMVISTLEGKARVRAFGIEQIAFAGTTVTVPLSDDLTPSGPPTFPVGYNQEVMQMLPISVLPDVISAAPPLSTDEILALLNAENGSDDGSSDGSGDDPDNVKECKPEAGESCNAPGLGGTCPGNSCKDKDK